MNQLIDAIYRAGVLVGKVWVAMWKAQLEFLKAAVSLVVAMVVGILVFLRMGLSLLESLWTELNQVSEEAGTVADQVNNNTLVPALVDGLQVANYVFPLQEAVDVFILLLAVMGVGLVYRAVKHLLP